MLAEERRLTIVGVLESVPQACEFVATAARDAGLDDRAVYHCHLAVDEACTNVIEHGYASHGKDHVVDLLCKQDGQRFVITITDDSPAFDPLTVAEPDRTTPILEREVGGLGVYFIRKLMDEVSYQHMDNRNRLVMIKHIPQPPATDAAIPTAAAHPIRAYNLTPKIRMLLPNGRLDASQIGQLEAAFSREMAAGYKLLVLNMADVDYISSAGLKTLVSLWQRARDAKGDLVLTTLKPRVREVLEIIGLDLVFGIFDTPEKAVSRMSYRK
jgi:serine/threonine-protein kinase RsbW